VTGRLHDTPIDTGSDCGTSSDALGQNLRPSDLQDLFDGCMDASVAIRKQAMSSLSSLLLQYPQDRVMQRV